MTTEDERPGEGHPSTEVSLLGLESSEIVADASHPVPNPGLEPHLPRLTDVDQRAAKRVERQIATLFGLVPLLAIGFVVAYFGVHRDTYINFPLFRVNAQHVLLGATLGLAILFIGIGAVQWARQLMADVEMVEQRHSAMSTAEDREDVLDKVDGGIEESGIKRRKILGYSLLGALGALLIPAAVSLADLGPYPTRKGRLATIETTIWSEGIRLVNDITYTPIKPGDIQIGQLVNGQPANLQDLHGTEFLQAKAKCSIILVRMNPADIKIPDSRKDWQVGGILAYSKICTHVGCPISLWEQQTHHLLCPCHQSTFDLADSGVVVFGPAARSLPQLPITVDPEGYLVARSGFNVPVGPSFFERDSRHDFKQGDN